jgi:hypothetical protein
MAETFRRLGPLLQSIGEKAMVVLDALTRAFDSRMLKDMVGQLGKFIGWLDLMNPAALEDLGKMFAFVAKAIGAGLFVVIAFIAATLKLVEIVRGVAVGIFEVLGSVADKMLDIGANIVAGLVSGITGGVDKISDAAGKIAGTFLGTIKEKFKISSPSRVMMGMGDQIGEGLAIGLDRSMPSIDVPGGSFGGASGGAVAGLAGGGVVINLGGITVNGTSEAASREAANRVESDIRGALMSAIEGFAHA